MYFGKKIVLKIMYFYSEKLNKPSALCKQGRWTILYFNTIRIYILYSIILCIKIKTILKYILIEIKNSLNYI